MTDQHPVFSGGRNIALKVPPHRYEATVGFYRDVLRLPAVSGPTGDATGFGIAGVAGEEAEIDNAEGGEGECSARGRVVRWFFHVSAPFGNERARTLLLHCTKSKPGGPENTMPA